MHSGAPWQRPLVFWCHFRFALLEVLSEIRILYPLAVSTEVCGTQNRQCLSISWDKMDIKQLGTAQKLEPTPERGEQTRTVLISVSIAHSCQLSGKRQISLNESLHNTQAS